MRGNAHSAQHSLRRRRRATLWGLAGILLLGMMLSFTLGRYPVPPRELLGILAAKLGFPIERFWTAQMEQAIWNIRLPRVLLSVFVGASLATAGAAFQAVFQNPMASPDVLGASAGAGFGAALALLLNLPSGMVTMLAFVMSLATVVFVFMIGRYVKGDRLLGLVLAGIITGSLCQSAISYIKLVADPANKLPQITYWLMGSLAGAGWQDIRLAALPMSVGMVFLLLSRWQINVLTMGDDEARSLGVNAPRVRMRIILCSTLLTAAAVSVSGMIGWVGLVIPHMMRRITGSDYRYLMGASAMGGGIFLLLVDDLSRTISEAGVPLGILTAFLGAPLFLLFITGKATHYEG